MVSGFYDIHPVWTKVCEFLQDGGFVYFWSLHKSSSELIFCQFFCLNGSLTWFICWTVWTCLQSSQMLRVTSVEAWRITIARSPSWDGFLWARNTAIFRSSSRPSCVYTAKGKIRHGAQDFLFFTLSTPAAVLDALFFQGKAWRIWDPHGLHEGHHGKPEACHTVQTDRSSWYGAPVPKSFSLLNRFMSDSFHFHVTFIHGNLRVPPRKKKKK